MTKFCSKCKTDKPKTEFRQKSGRPVGQLESWCRGCKLIGAQSWKERHPERTRELSRKSAAEFFRRNPDRVRENARERYWRNPGEGKNRTKVWQSENTDRVKELKRNRMRQRREQDLDFKILTNIRSRISSALRAGSKGLTTVEILGCDWPSFREWIQKQFLPGMSWENYGAAWHIDHIRPCASFFLENELQQRLCFHHSNLRPLWKQDNLKKSDSVRVAFFS